MHQQLLLNYRYLTAILIICDILLDLITQYYIAKQNLIVTKVRVNDPKSSPLFSSGLIGKDNSIARHGIHGLYWLYNVDVPGNRLVEGNNTVFLTQPRSTSPFQGIMYDYIRLEGPPSASTSK